MQKKAYFRFEASSSIGAGHAIRSCVIADALSEQGWICSLVASKESYDFIQDLNRFCRIDPEAFYNTPPQHDLLVVDHYDLDAMYEKHFRPYAQKIMVIDDLANRVHDCDILLDQTYGRIAEDYRFLVPDECQAFTGTDYALLRKEFILMRPKALKRRKTGAVQRILISMGGADAGAYTLQVLQEVSSSGFTGAIDVVLGFQDNSRTAVEAVLQTMPNVSMLHVNPRMAQLMYKADLAIGAAGSSVWERCCLGLPQVVVQTANNQSSNWELFSSYTLDSALRENHRDVLQRKLCALIDGLGVRRLSGALNGYRDRLNQSVYLSKVKEEDAVWLYGCQQISDLRRFSFNKNPPSLDEHMAWFAQKIADVSCIFEKIMSGTEVCGVLRLDYEPERDHYVLSWYILPEFRRRGIGAIALTLAKEIAKKRIIGFVFDENLPSVKAMESAGFFSISREGDGVWYAS